jgi:iron only hydrogenase large subunit-like protein
MKPSILVGDISDYLEPSQVCIKKEDQPPKENTVVTINLTDCLACAGCITSAETILVAQQSWEMVKNAIKENIDLVFSVSPQSRVAIAHALNKTIDESDNLILSFLSSLPKVRAIFDTNIGRNYSLTAVAREFINKYQTDSSSLPLLSSACPGWICFVEKTHPELIPFVSQARSPQQIMGSLVKELNDPNCFHVSVMPCYDKKLEASRDSFLTTATGKPHIDCVITSRELLELIQKANFPQSPHLNPFTKSHEGSGAGGYLEYTLKHAAFTLFNISPEQINVKETFYRGNVDFVEYELLSPIDNNVLLRFARIWGMRNIQTWMRLHKASPKKYHFVEVMACASGCLNGGGQPPLNGDKSKLISIKQLYADLPKVDEPQIDPEIYGKLDQMGLLWTNYRPLKKQSSSFSIKW